jgi:hypothetical protein
MWRHFKSGKSILMLAPRRVGKTVLLNRLKDESDIERVRAVLVDVEGFRDEKAFFRHLCATIQEESGSAKSLLNALVARFGQLKEGVAGAGDWRSLLLNSDLELFAGHLLRTLNEDADGRPWVVLVDELPIFICALLTEENGHKRAHDFLYQLRSYRQKFKNVRWLFTGSIGLDGVARRQGIEGALVDLELESIGPFDRPTAKAFLEQIGQRRGLRFAPEASLAIIDRLGWLSPYYLEKIAEAACDLGLPEYGVGAEQATRAMDGMLELSKRTYWATWREHLDKNFLEPESGHLFRILALVSTTVEGATIDTLLAALGTSGGGSLDARAVSGLLETLEADGYLLRCDGGARYCFSMNLLREWWVRHVQ